MTCDAKGGENGWDTCFVCGGPQFEFRSDQLSCLMFFVLLLSFVYSGVLFVAL